MGWPKALGFLGLSALLLGCSASPGEMMAAACEAVLKERLLSPAGYLRVSWEMRSRPMTAEEYRDRYVAVNLITTPVDVAIAGVVQHTLHTGTLEYDAPNAFGVLLREKAHCDLDTSGKSDFELDLARHYVQVDGMSRQKWLIGQRP